MGNNNSKHTGPGGKTSVAGHSNNRQTGAASHQQGSKTSAPPGKMHTDSRTRYFIIKCNSHKNLVSSIQHNVWATQRHNEKKLNEALRVSPYVVLLFSVNQSGSFQGYARMTGRCGESDREDPFAGFGALFNVKWLKLHDLDFAELSHLNNPWNDGLSIKISRDGQELPNSLGRTICGLIDEGVYLADPDGFIADDEEPNEVPPDAPLEGLPLFPESNRSRGVNDPRAHHNNYRNHQRGANASSNNYHGTPGGQGYHGATQGPQAYCNSEAYYGAPAPPPANYYGEPRKHNYYGGRGPGPRGGPYGP